MDTSQKHIVFVSSTLKKHSFLTSCVFLIYCSNKQLKQKKKTKHEATSKLCCRLIQPSWNALLSYYPWTNWQLLIQDSLSLVSGIVPKGSVVFISSHQLAPTELGISTRLMNPRGPGNNPVLSSFTIVTMSTTCIRANECSPRQLPAKDGVQLSAWRGNWKWSCMRNPLTLCSVPALVLVQVWMHIPGDPHSVQLRNATTTETADNLS